MFSAPLNIPVIVVTGVPAFDYFFTLCLVFGVVSVAVMILVRLLSRS